MQSSRRLLGGGAIGSLGVLALIVCASLLFAASASAKVAEYQAPLKLSGANNGYITFKVKSKKNKQTKKFRPVLIKKFGLFTVTKCNDGVEQEADYYPSLAPWPTKIPVSGGKFSLSDSGGYEVQGGTFTYTIEFSGHVPRHGSPTGTLRYKTNGPKLVPDPNNPDPDAPYVQAQVPCDTGPMTWTGQRLPPNSL